MVTFDSSLEAELGEPFDVYAASLGFDQGTARGFATGVRPECLSLRWPGLPFGDFLASGADWWAGQALDLARGVVPDFAEEYLGISPAVADVFPGSGLPTRSASERPTFGGGAEVPPGGWVVQVPDWRDVFVAPISGAWDERDRRARLEDTLAELERSPTPANLQEVARLLTAIDDLQDEFATLAAVAMVTEKAIGRAIPGVGLVATAADALNVVGAFSRVGTGSAFPGRGAKRAAAGRGIQSVNGYGVRLQELRRTGDFRFTKGDLVQGLQASESWFGVGLQLGGIVGFLQDTFWGAVRGAEFRARGPVWDPFGLTEAGRSVCSRSPRLSDLAERGYFTLGNSALRLWSKAARIGPFLDRVGERVFAEVLIGMRLAESVLGPWLRRGIWLEALRDVLAVGPEVLGGIEAAGMAGKGVEGWVDATAPATIAALRRGLGQVADRERQAFYDSVAASVGWGLMGSVEPGAVILERGLRGPIQDAKLLLEVGLVPEFDLGDG